MREIGVLTTSRADFGIYEPVLEAMSGSRLRARIVASGAHLETRLGRTEREIERSGWRIFRRVPAHGRNMAQAMARATANMGKLLERWRPDILLVLGDRFETLACALAAAASLVPIAHIHGGEVTAGALDEGFRHSLSKLAALHFASSEDAARRLRQLGEEPWRITVSGAPALDRLRAFEPEAIEGLPEDFLLVTYHPVTLEPGREAAQVGRLVAALSRIGLPCVVTAPNADPGRDVIEARLRRFCARDPRSRFVASAGAARYFTLMQRAKAMVGNSSSGILEAPSFRLPVVNVGSRQEGRLRARNVIDASDSTASIVRAVRRALTPAFRRSIARLASPYGDGHAAERIVRVLERVQLGDRLLRKRFQDARRPS